MDCKEIGKHPAAVVNSHFRLPCGSAKMRRNLSELDLSRSVIERLALGLSNPGLLSVPLAIEETDAVDCWSSATALQVCLTATHDCGQAFGH